MVVAPRGESALGSHVEAARRGEVAALTNALQASQ